MSGGGSGGGGSTNVAQFMPPDYAANLWGDYLNNASAITQSQYTPFSGMQVAPINNTQAQAMQMLANYSGNTAPDVAAARANNQLTASGGYEDPTFGMQTQVGWNPWYGAEVPTQTPQDMNPYLGQRQADGSIRSQSSANVGNVDPGLIKQRDDLMAAHTNVNPNDWTQKSINGGNYDPLRGQWNGQVNGGDYRGIVGDFSARANGGDYKGLGSNPWADKTTNAGTNSYVGFGPQYQAMKDRSMGDLARAYATGTAAQTDSAFNHPGAFGASPHQNQISANEYNLGQSLGNLSEKMDMDQWQNSGQLQGQDLGRSASTALQDYGRNAQYTNAGQQLGTNAELADLGRMAQYGNAGLDRSMQAQLGDLGRNYQYQNAGLDRFTNAQNQDLSRQGSLYDSALSRELNANQGDLNRQFGMTQAELARITGANQNDLGRQSNLWENAINRQIGIQTGNIDRNSAAALAQQQLGLQAQNMDATRWSNSWNNERNRQMETLPQALQGQAGDLNNARSLLSVGDMQRQYSQDTLNLYLNSFNQFQQYPYQMLDAMGNALSRASGNYGTNTSTGQQNYQANPLASLLGAGLLGAGAYNAWGQ